MADGGGALSGPGSIKGSSHQSTTIYLERAFGEEAVERVYAAIDPAQTALLRSLRAKDWCPLPAFCAYMLAADRIYGNGDLALCRELGNASARWQIPTLLRMAIRMFSPLQGLGHIPQIWSRMMDRGHVEAIDTGERAVTLRMHDFDPHHRAMCERLSGFLEAAVEMTGGTSPTLAHTRCRTAGNLICEYTVTWLPRMPGK